MSKFIKQQIKSLDTADRVESLLVFDAGGDQPRRISKTLYDSSLPTASGGNYKSYVALLNQNGTNAPTANVLYNDLGEDVIWTYGNVGQYIGTCNAFTENKTIVWMGQAYDSTAIAVNYAYMTAYPDMSVQTALDNVLTDELLFNTPIEFRVYP